MDKIFFTGRLGQDPEQKTSQSGNEYSRLNVAVTHFNKGGEKTTEWRNVSAFGKTAEYCQKYLKKGSFVVIEGYPSPRAYNPKTGGDPVGVIDVRAESVDGVSSGDGGENAQSTQQTAAPAQQAQVADIPDDELPF